MGYTSNSKVAAAVLTKRQRLPWHTFMWHHHLPILYQLLPTLFGKI